MFNEDYKQFLQVLVELEDLEEIDNTIQNADINSYDKTSYEEVKRDFWEYLDCVLRDKIDFMLSQDKLLKQKALKGEIYKWLNKFVPFRKDAEELISAYSITKTEPKEYTIEELLQKAKKEDNYIVKRLLPTGSLILLAAMAKVGKSLFATNLAVSVSRGLNFLNQSTRQCNVLYIQNEERLETTTVNRIYTNGLQLLELENPELYKELIKSNRLTIVRDIDFALEQNIILELVKKHNVSLVIIDSLIASLTKSGLTEFNPEVGSHLYRLQHLCQEHGFSVLMVHHTTKMDANDDKLKALSGVGGSNIITRANDGIFKLFPNNIKGKEDEIILNTIPREGEPITMTLGIEKGEACHWYYNVLKEETLTLEMLELQNLILELLYERYNQWYVEIGSPKIDETFDPTEYPQVYGLSLNELIQLTNQSRSVLIQRLNDMKRSDGIKIFPNKKNKTFIYHINYDGESWLKLYLEKHKEMKRKEQEQMLIKQAHVNKINDIVENIRLALKQKNVERLEAIYSQLNKKEQEDVTLKLEPEEIRDVYILVIPPEFSIGEKVIIKKTGEISEINNLKYESRAKIGYYNYYINNISYTKDKLKKIDEIQTDS